MDAVRGAVGPIMARMPLGRSLALGLALATAALGAACGRAEPSGPPSGSSGPPTATGTAERVPLPPPTSPQSLGPGQPPVIWVGGVLTDLTGDRLQLREGSGSEVSLLRLAEGATAFFVVDGSQWRRLEAEEEVGLGQETCVETLVNGSSFVAIRVFLGAGCGPA
jgi:hypothetical protein